jgi:transcriptional regulator with XRE-family HTH domain
MMTIAKTIKAAVEEKKWTSSHVVAALADRGIKISPITVDRWISGVNEPRSSILVHLADVLGCTVADLLGCDNARSKAHV